MANSAFFAASAITISMAMPVAAGGLAAAVVERDNAEELSSQIGWDGLYAGVHAGYGRSDFTNFDSDEDNDNAWWGEANYGSSFDGFLGGATVGYNVVRGSYLYGVEGELGLALIEGSEIDAAGIAANPGATDTGDETRPETTVEINAYANIAGRFGYLKQRTLVYGKVGFGVMDADVSFEDRGYFAGDDCCGISNGSDSLTLSGGVLGAGIEYALANQMTLKVEYLRYLVGGDTVFPVAYDGDSDEYEQIVEIDDVDTLKIGLNWRF